MTDLNANLAKLKIMTSVFEGVGKWAAFSIIQMNLCVIIFIIVLYWQKDWQGFWIFTVSLLVINIPIYMILIIEPKKMVQLWKLAVGFVTDFVR